MSWSERLERIAAYYAGSRVDTETFWGANIHFGYWAPGDDLRDRPAMLTRMNQETFAALSPLPSEARIADLGCGLGAPLLDAAARWPGAHLVGVNITEAHIAHARCAAEPRITLIRADYTRLPFADASFDGVYCIESACYAPGADKRPLLSEIHRILRPGGRFAIADGFVRRPPPRGRAFEAIYHRLCTAWAMEQMAEIHAFVETATNVGFTALLRRDISWNVAPSIAHVPWDVGRTVWRAVQDRRRWTEAEVENLVAPSLQVLLSAFPLDVGYFIVAGRKSY